MTEVLALIDYGAGNLYSVENALKAAGRAAQWDGRVALTADPDVVRCADRIVLPGVGSFRACAEGLRAIPGLIAAMEERVLVGTAPFLGICVGMQLLATQGVEHGITPGLGWIPGEVRLIEPADATIKIPHMGWNDVVGPHHGFGHHTDGATLITPGEAYFLHSYHFVPEDGHHIAAITDHGGGLVAAVAQANILGVQFHPEKSQSYGLELLGRFLEWKP